MNIRLGPPGSSAFCTRDLGSNSVIGSGSGCTIELLSAAGRGDPTEYFEERGELSNLVEDGDVGSRGDKTEPSAESD